MRLVIRSNDEPVRGRRLVGCHYRYWLDDVEITNSLQGLELTMGVREANVAKLQLLVDDVEVDAEFMTQLRAHLETVPT